MKRIGLLAILMLTAFLAMGQGSSQYQRHGKKTSAEIAAIDVSNTNYVYTATDIDLGIEVINWSDGNGWVPRIDPESGSTLLPPNQLSLGTQTTDASYENVLNRHSLLGTYTVNLASDATYNHPIGTILWFYANSAGGESVVNYGLDTGATGFTPFTLQSPKLVAFTKVSSNEWRILSVSDINDNISGVSTLLPEYVVPSNTETTDADFEDSLVTMGGAAGIFTITLASDATYDHPDGTILTFRGNGEGLFTFVPDTGVTGFTSFTTYLTTQFIKVGTDEWRVLGITTAASPVTIHEDTSGSTDNLSIGFGNKTEAAAATVSPIYDLYFITNADAMDEVTAGSTTIDFVDANDIATPFLFLDNTTDDVESFTINDMNIGYWVEIYLNQANEPTFSNSPTLVGGLDWTTDGLANIDVTILVFRTGKGVRKAYRLGH